MLRGNLQVRVRPHKVAVLLPWEATQSQCLKAIAFLSKLWGGMYCLLVPVRGRGDNELAEVWLRDQRPDAVFGLDVVHRHWSEVCDARCQPYVYDRLDGKDTSELLRDSPLELVTAWPAYQVASDENPPAGRRPSNMLVVDPDPSCSFAAHLGATFGVGDEAMRDALVTHLGAWNRSFGDELSAAEYVRTCGAMSSRLSLLRLGSYRLGHQTMGLGSSPCRKVVVSTSLGADVALFWDLRMAWGSGFAGPVLLFPSSAVEDGDAVGALAEWLTAGDGNCNYCELLSLSTPGKVMARLARRLRPRVARAGLAHVDLKFGPMGVPHVVPTDRVTHVSATVEERILACKLPTPRFHEALPNGRTWVVDLVRDDGTRRRPMELSPTCNPVVPHVLNAPSPQHALTEGVYRVREGVDAISVRCCKSHGGLRIVVPTEAELLEATLTAAGMKLRADEKRRTYTALMEVFGGHMEAARAFTGAARRMLDALAVSPLTWGQLMKAASAGRGTKPLGPVASDRGGWIKNPVSRRLWVARSKAYLADCHPRPGEAADVLGYWETKRIIAKRLELPACPACGHRQLTDRMELSSPPICGACGGTIALPDAVHFKYLLNPLVSRSIREGVGPVLLTGRFLRNLTARGFMWLPGAKGVFGDKEMDVDVVASCDGHLALVECKTLLKTKPGSDTWRRILEKLPALVKLARACRADMVFIASLATE